MDGERLNGKWNENVQRKSESFQSVGTSLRRSKRLLDVIWDEASHFPLGRCGMFLGRRLWRLRSLALRSGNLAQTRECHILFFEIPAWTQISFEPSESELKGLGAYQSMKVGVFSCKNGWMSVWTWLKEPFSMRASTKSLKSRQKVSLSSVKISCRYWNVTCCNWSSDIFLAAKRTWAEHARIPVDLRS